jgi:hypothetical protein
MSNIDYVREGKRRLYEVMSPHRGSIRMVSTKDISKICFDLSFMLHQDLESILEEEVKTAEALNDESFELMMMALSHKNKEL